MFVTNLDLRWVKTTRPGFAALASSVVGRFPITPVLFWFHRDSVSMLWDARRGPEAHAAHFEVEVSFPPKWNGWRSQRGPWWVNTGRLEGEGRRHLSSQRSWRLGRPIIRMRGNVCLVFGCEGKKKAVKKRKKMLKTNEKKGRRERLTLTRERHCDVRCCVGRVLSGDLKHSYVTRPCRNVI